MGLYKIRTDFGHHMKIVLWVLAAVFVVGAIFTFSFMPDLDEGERTGPSAVVATVNGLEITRGEFETAWEQMAESVRDQQGMRSTLMFARVRAQVFQNLIGMRIADVTAQKMGVNISQRAVEDKREEILVSQLRERRRQVLGKLTAEQEKLDPRNDDEFKAELAKTKGPDGLPLTLAQITQVLQRNISDAQIRQAIAMEGIEKSLRAKVGVVTPQDVKNSYNVYKFRVISFQKNIPQAQLANRVNKVADEAKKGKDFAALAKQHSMDPAKGEIQTAEFGTVTAGVWDTLGKMKAGQVSNPIDSGDTIYIVKLESVEQKQLEKMDKKTQDQRKEMIRNVRMGQEYQKFQEDLKRDLKIKVTDPELNGYYLLSLAQQATTPAQAGANLRKAQKAFEDAIVKMPNNAYAQAMLADVLQGQGKDDKAIQVLYQLLESEGSSGTGVDLRMMLGDLLAKKGKKDEAVTQYTKASEEARIDVGSHRMLATKFKSVGRADLAAKETAIADDYENKLKVLQEQQQKNAPRP